MLHSQLAHLSSEPPANPRDDNVGVGGSWSIHHHHAVVVQVVVVVIVVVIIVVIVVVIVGVDYVDHQLGGKNNTEWNETRKGRLELSIKHLFGHQSVVIIVL